jgi:hypothetical protein
MCSGKHPVISLFISGGCALYTKCSHYDETSSVFVQCTGNSLFLIGAYVPEDEMDVAKEGDTPRPPIQHPIALSVVSGRRN